MLFYHLRGGYEWISELVPTYALWTILAMTVSFSVLNKIRKL